MGVIDPNMSIWGYFGGQLYALRSSRRGTVHFMVRICIRNAVDVLRSVIQRRGFADSGV